ncbi:MAG: amidohydrolase [Ruminococcaceae bacterium]|nr:amidohydrolase [Oscillospiraceae bacterium]
MQYKIYDFHTHVYPDEIAVRAVEALNKFYNFKCDCNGTYGELEETSLDAKVCGFLMLGTATNAHQVEKVNDFVANCVQMGKAHFLEAHGFAAMHQDYTDIEKEIERVTKLGLCGFKVHPDIQRVNIDDERLMRLYKACEGKMPVYLHIGDYREEYRYSEIKRLYKVIEKYPQLCIIAAHLGGYSAWDVADTFAGYDKIYYDTSSALEYMDRPLAESLIERLGADKIMFGTDYPCTTAKSGLDRFLKLHLSERERKDILYNNADIFFKKYCPNV